MTAHLPVVAGACGTRNLTFHRIAPDDVAAKVHRIALVIRDANSGHAMLGAARCTGAARAQ